MANFSEYVADATRNLRSSISEFFSPRVMSEASYRRAYSKELAELDKANMLGAPDVPTRRRAQLLAYPNMESGHWWKYPLLNQQMTRELPKLPQGPKQFSSITPVLLTPEQLRDKRIEDRRIEDRRLSYERSKIQSPIDRAFRYIKDSTLGGGAY